MKILPIQEKDSKEPKNQFVVLEVCETSIVVRAVIFSAVRISTRNGVYPSWYFCHPRMDLYSSIRKKSSDISGGK